MSEGRSGVDRRQELVATVARAVAEHTLWAPGAPLLVAVSGGADSLCLLGALLDLRAHHDPHAPGELVVATLDHGLRGLAGAADAAWVAGMAHSLGLRCLTATVDAQTEARIQHLSLEDAARQLRYRFLRQVARDVGVTRIVLAHTRDDQAETLLLHLLRGAGLSGLAGMRPLRGDIARPLLAVSRAQTLAYCAARGWEPRDDETNHDERYVRNRVRRRLLPEMERINPRARQALARAANALADDDDALEQRVELIWSEILEEEAPRTISLRLEELANQPRALRRRLIRRASARLLASDDPEAPTTRLEERHIALIERLALTEATGATLDLPGDLRATHTYTALRMSRAATDGGARAQPLRDQQSPSCPLTAPGVVEARALGWRVRAVISESPPGFESDLLPDAPDLPPPGHAGSAAALPRGAWRAYADADVAGEKLCVRAWRPGDRFRPLGLTYARKLQDVFTDAKVPRDVRAQLPLVCVSQSGEEHVLWVAGLRIGDEFKLTSSTRRTLVLQAEPLDAADGAWSGRQNRTTE
jgi:tRNA(Ile)-lysidine synthase